MFTIGLNVNQTDIDLIEKINRIAYCGVGFITISTFYNIVIVLDIKKHLLWSKINFIYGFFLCYLLIKTNYIISDIQPFDWGYYPKAGPYHPLFLLYFLILVFHSDFYMVKKIINTTPGNKESLQTKYNLASFMILSLALIDFIPNYGFKIYPIGCVPATIFLLITAYAVFKYQLMDINIVIKKGLVYSATLTFVSTIYLISALLIDRFFQKTFGYESFFINLSIVLLFCILFIPLRYQAQKIIDRIFFKGSKDDLISENERLRFEITKAEKLKIMSTLSSSIAHEIKNPLTAINTFSEHLPQKKDDPEFLDTFSKIITSETKRITELIHQLLDFSKPTPPDFALVNPDGIICDVINLVENDLTKHNITIHKNLDCQNIQINADSNQLKQVFLNIILNAKDAMPTGGKIEISSHIDQDKCFIEVKDSGFGISEEKLKNIFEPFYTDKHKGTGLGLSIVHNIIENHKGKINVISALNKGTTFQITLPVSEDRS